MEIEAMLSALNLAGVEPNLIGYIEAIQMLNPDLSREEAKAKLIQIRRERTEFI